MMPREEAAAFCKDMERLEVRLTVDKKNVEFDNILSLFRAIVSREIIFYLNSGQPKLDHWNRREGR